jgi:hypothetical protein
MIAVDVQLQSGFLLTDLGFPEGTVTKKAQDTKTRYGRFER